MSANRDYLFYVIEEGDPETEEELAEKIYGCRKCAASIHADNVGQEREVEGKLTKGDVVVIRKIPLPVKDVIIKTIIYLEELIEEGENSEDVCELSLSRHYVDLWRLEKRLNDLDDTSELFTTLFFLMLVMTAIGLMFS